MWVHEASPPPPHAHTEGMEEAPLGRLCGNSSGPRLSRRETCHFARDQLGLPCQCPAAPGQVTAHCCVPCQCPAAPGQVTAHCCVPCQCPAAPAQVPASPANFPGSPGHVPAPCAMPREKQPRPRPVRVRFFEFYRAARVRSASAAVSPQRSMVGHFCGSPQIPADPRRSLQIPTSCAVQVPCMCRAVGAPWVHRGVPALRGDCASIWDYLSICGPPPPASTGLLVESSKLRPQIADMKNEEIPTVRFEGGLCGGCAAGSSVPSSGHVPRRRSRLRGISRHVPGVSPVSRANGPLLSLGKSRHGTVLCQCPAAPGRLVPAHRPVQSGTSPWPW
eukprot:gene20450-biopygen20602